MSTTEQRASDLELRPLSPKATPEVFRAAQRLVSIKTALDDLCRSHRSVWIVEQLCSQTLNSAHSALDGQAFLWAVVPFIQDAEPEVPALVPLETMIGESWRWHECTGTSTTAEELQAYLTNPDRAFRTNRDASLSTCVAPLGLTVAFEGKNRVRFLRDRGVKYIPSAVAVAGYPTPDRLKIFHVYVGSERKSWCVLDDRWLEPLVLPALTHVILDAYGVESFYSWLGQWPKIEMVEAAAKAKTRERSIEPIDLQRLRQRELEHLGTEDWVISSFLDLNLYRIRWKPLLWGAFLIAGTTLAARLYSEGLAERSSWGLVGLATGVAVAWCCPVIRARRKHVS